MFQALRTKMDRLLRSGMLVAQGHIWGRGRPLPQTGALLTRCSAVSSRQRAALVGIWCGTGTISSYVASLAPNGHALELVRDFGIDHRHANSSCEPARMRRHHQDVGRADAGAYTETAGQQRL